MPGVLTPRPLLRTWKGRSWPAGMFVSASQILEYSVGSNFGKAISDRRRMALRGRRRTMVHQSVSTLHSRATLIRTEPIPRNVQLPDIIAERCGMAADDPQFVLKHVRRMFVTLCPDRLRLEFSPVLAIARVPDVVPVPMRFNQLSSPENISKVFSKVFFGMKRFFSSKNTLRDAREAGAN